MEVVLDEQKATARTSLRTCAPTLTANNRQQHATILCILMALHSRVDRAPPANNTTEISLLPRDPKRSACSTCCDPGVHVQSFTSPRRHKGGLSTSVPQGCFTRVHYRILHVLHMSRRMCVRSAHAGRARPFSPGARRIDLPPPHFNTSPTLGQALAKNTRRRSTWMRKLEEG